jgi:pheromone shutdown protein TraB
MARDLKTPVICGDQDQNITLTRMGQSLLPDITKTSMRLITDSALRRRLVSMADNNSPLGRSIEGFTGTPTREQLEAIIEATKDRHSISDIMSIMQLTVPNVHQALIADRDIVLTK